VSNTNLGSESFVGLVEEGLDTTLQASQTLGVPVRFAMIQKSVADSQRNELEKIVQVYGVPVFEMDRSILPPWEGIAQS
jgi:hypothetical protein